MNFDERLSKFSKIAEKKGAKISVIDAPKEIHEGEESFSKSLHFDLNMLDQSISDALEYAKDTLFQIQSSEQSRMKETKIWQGVINRLEALASNGTNYEKSVFCFGSGTYYFPEDIHALAETAEESENRVSPQEDWDCVTVCYVVCRCLPSTWDQECREMCRWACGPFSK